MQHQIAEFLKPVAQLVYNEVYLYIWFICIYSIFLMIITLANMYMLLKLWSHATATTMVAAAAAAAAAATKPSAATFF